MTFNPASWLPAILPAPSGYGTFTVTGNTSIDDDTFENEAIEVVGAPAGDVTLTLPVGKYARWVWNHTTGGHALIVTTGSGNTVTIATAKGAGVQCTGTEMRRRTADVTP